MLFGYARVSTDDQNLDLQHAAFQAPRLNRCVRIVPGISRRSRIDVADKVLRAAARGNEVGIPP